VQPASSPINRASCPSKHSWDFRPLESTKGCKFESRRVLAKFASPSAFCEWDSASWSGFREDPRSKRTRASWSSFLQDPRPPGPHNYQNIVVMRFALTKRKYPKPHRFAT